MILSAYSHPVAEAEVPELSAMPLDVVALLAQAHHPRAGAVVLFSGEVRNHNNGMDVDYLEYEAHKAMAAKMIKQIIADAHDKFPLNIAVAQHRTGKVIVGETAVVVITASAHRSEAYAANQYIIDRIKHEATIWKCEYFSDGTKQWGGNCSCH
ncbi:MAG: molybdenum cofactor biosynthesis protein MoaE [Mucilaginibacter sp.]|uniref:molybdenum cofactor biosynthesis protein MoaE n=1 Tax=Mucilaginibacter sp. TaxID=1882438 RepID=UPI0032630FB4